ncbi:MAG: LysM peptidoglycan-binding domain-containing M23 family metallopeptidase [Myxococcales bacterium]|nr:LysM peptidoglycan-binding domain-containing M23 family metallopeptidase [Myxococcales bacterium]
MVRAPTAVLVTGLALVIACGEGEKTAKSPKNNTPTPSPATEPKEVTHTVGEGETLWDIARAYGTTVDEVMAANDLTPRDVTRLSKGKALRIPGATQPVDVLAFKEEQRKGQVAPEDLPELTDGVYHWMAPGETVWGLSRLYEVPMDQILDRNGFDDEAVGRIRPGDPVIIPGATKAKSESNSKERPTGISHTVEPGETVWDMANTFKVSVAEIMAANGLNEKQVTLLREGTRLFIPGVTEDRKGRVSRRATRWQEKAAVVAKRLGLGSRKAAGDLLGGRIKPSWIRAAGSTSRLPGDLRWPVTKGWYVRGFGSGEGGYHLAMDIMGEIGWNVRAAAPGIVGYSGNEVRGFGNIVIVIHPGGWATLYAHNSVNFVVAGEQVKEGTILAEVGSTGISRGPHVHFELIFDRKNCDPAPLFRPGVRHRHRPSKAFSKVEWRRPKDRPRQVSCMPRRRHPRSRWVIHEDPEKDSQAGE